MAYCYFSHVKNFLIEVTDKGRAQLNMGRALFFCNGNGPGLYENGPGWTEKSRPVPTEQ